MRTLRLWLFHFGGHAMRTLEDRIGHKISTLRRAYGLTQAQLAEKVDVVPETISRIENGRRTASLGLLARIADAIELEFHEIFKCQRPDNPKTVALDKLLWFALRLSVTEIDHLLEIGVVIFKPTYRSQRSRVIEQ